MCIRDRLEAVTIHVSLARAPPSGNGSCEQPGLLSFNQPNHCVAGCCVDGRCVCRSGYVGARCDIQLACTSAVALRDGFSE
eukprot:5505444-Prymnesium_polylepis.1